MRERLEDLITEKAVGALRQMDISEIVVREGTELIREKVKGTMLSMMLNEQMIQSIAAPIGEEIENYPTDCSWRNCHDGSWVSGKSDFPYSFEKR